MPNYRLGASSLNLIPLDWEGNFQRILQQIKDAQYFGVDGLCLPELSITGYGCEDMFLHPATADTALKYLQKLIPEIKNQWVILGLPMYFQGELYNVAAVIHDQELIGLVPKQYLANDGLHYEPRWFKAWPKGKREKIKIRNKNIPFGDYTLQSNGIHFGIEICQDAWEAENRPAYSFAARGVNCIFSPTASHYAFHKPKIRQNLVSLGANIISGTYVFANLLGNESGRTIFDGDTYIYSNDKFLAHGKRFSFTDGQLIYADIDFERNAEFSLDGVISFEKKRSKKPLKKTFFEKQDWETGTQILNEEFARAISLGLWDYMRKSHSNGWVLSLSGGADSSCIASLCKISLELANKELGMEGIQSRLSYTGQSFTQLKDWMRFLLTTLYQGTQNSSIDTRLSAKNLAEDIGSTHYDFDLDEVLNGYHHIIENAIQRPLTWETDDIALQNIQARLRSPSAWMLANINQALLLATSNRSEASVGYATMDGDTSGSISPISGIDKPFIRQWLKWMETKGLNNHIRIKGLKIVNGLEPSAELRPLDKKQVDEEDLMPYSILNDIEKLTFYDRLHPNQVHEHLIVKYSSKYSKKDLREFMDRFYRLWTRNQWKRERYAPGFHIDEYSLDPKSWLRFPILSKGIK